MESLALVLCIVADMAASVGSERSVQEGVSGRNAEGRAKLANVHSFYRGWRSGEAGSRTNERGFAANREEIWPGARATTSVPKYWLEKTHEIAPSNGVRPELPIGAPTKSDPLWE